MLAAQGFAVHPANAFKVPVGSAGRSSLPRLQDLAERETLGAPAVGPAVDVLFHSVTTVDSSEVLPAPEAPTPPVPSAEPLVAATDLAVDLVMGTADHAVAAVLAGEEKAGPDFFFEGEVAAPPETPPEFFFEEGAPAATAAAPIDPLTGQLPHGVELPIAVPSKELSEVLDLPLVTPKPPDGTTELPSLRELGLFCLPTLGIWLSSPLLSLIDTSVVGLTCATHHLAALAPSTKLCDYVAFFCSVIGAATTNLAADAFAHGEPERAKRVIGSSLSISLAMGAAVAALLGITARPLMASMLGGGMPGPMLTAATQYTTIRALGYPAALLTMVLQSAFISTKDSKSPLLAVPLAAGVNLIADLLLVPSMGAAGAAWATTLALYTNAVTLLAMWARKARTIGAEQTSVLVLPRMKDAKALLAFAAPMTVALISRVFMGFSITLSAVALGATALAANQIIESLYWLFCPFGEAISLCMQAYLPPLLLHGRSLARRLQAQAFRAAGVLGIVAAFAAAILPVASPGLFTTSAAVSAVATGAAPALGCVLFSYVLFCATEGMLIARKQLRFLAITHVVNAIAFASALRCVVNAPKVGLQHVWTLFAGFNVVRLFEFVWGLRMEDRAALAKRAEEPKRWRRALRGLRIRVAATRRQRREDIHDAIPPVEQIAPHLLATDGLMED